MDDLERIELAARRVADSHFYGEASRAFGAFADELAVLIKAKREREGMDCEDEGCPHYGTPHSHVVR